MDEYIKVYIKKMRKYYYIFSSILFVCFIVFNIAVPKIYVNLVSKDEQTMPKNLGLIDHWDYIRDTENATTDVTFDQTYTVNRWMYYSSEFKFLFDVRVTPIEVFEPDVLYDGFKENSNNEEFEYLYGGPYTKSHEVIIKAYVSEKIFNKVDSIGETLYIADQPFTIVGVVKNDINNYESIFISDQTYVDEAKLFSNDPVSIYLIDDDLVSKLYKLGGMELVSDTMRFNNQDLLNMQMKKIMNWMNAVFIGVYLLIRFLTIRYIRFLSDKETSFEKLLRACRIITLAFIIFLMIKIFSIAAHATIKVAMMYTFENILDFYYVLFIYAIAVIFYIIREINDKKAHLK